MPLGRRTHQRKASAAAWLVAAGLLCAGPALAQTPEPPNASTTPTLTVRSNLVLVPVMVRTKAGDIVFTLKADDFAVNDNGVEQKPVIEEGTGEQPLALAVVIQTGGGGADHLRDYHALASQIDSLVGGVKHRVAVIAFDDVPRVVLPFTSSFDSVSAAISSLQDEGDGAAILDALKYSMDYLNRQPPAYRRAILLISETIDGGSTTDLDSAIRSVSDTNTLIYSVNFSSTRVAAKQEAKKLPRPGGTPYSAEPYGEHGCMDHNDTAAHGGRAKQALDCASDLLPPLRLARVALTALRVSLARNTAKTLTEMTGGEYFTFKNEKTLGEALIRISNQIPNRYVLSFRPTAATPGMHALKVAVRGRPELQVQARSSYWIDDPESGAKKP